MRKAFLCLFTAWSCLVGSGAQAFLSDGDYRNFFTLLQNSSLVLVGSLKKAEAPTPGQPYYLYQLKSSEILKGAQGLTLVKAVDETLVLGKLPPLPAEGEFLACLGILPNFTAYQTLRQNGYEYRLLGGRIGILPLDGGHKAEILQLARDYLKADAARRYAVLLPALASSESRLANDAALALAEQGKINFSQEDVATVLGAIRDRPLLDTAKASLVKALENSANAVSIDALKQIADGPASYLKWASIRALERFGISRPVEKLAQDFREADDAQKAKMVGLIVRQKNGAAEEFAGAVLKGSYGIDVKRAVIDQMAQAKTPGYETLLIKEIPQGEDAVRAEAVLALGKMGSSQAVPLVIPLLESKSNTLRTAAFFMLTESSDPRAQELVSKRFVRDHHGVWSLEQNQPPPRDN